MTLAAPMREGDLRLEPLEQAHREPLRQACAEDPDVWQIYPMSFFGGQFDASFDTCFAQGNSFPFAILASDCLVGMSSYLNVDVPNHGLEIGRTYISPAVRGTGFNARVKQLMLDRAFASGFERVEFRIDTRNERSMAAVEKLGAMREGTLRRNRVTWTGHVRDTAVYSILAREWRSRAHSG
jgi:RimJ/RimL family protein N-acetyltransferase